MDPSIYDNYHDICQQEDMEEDSESDTFQSTKSQEIGFFESCWDFNEIDLGDFYQYDDHNIFSCIRYAHLHAQDQSNHNPMLDLYKPHKILPKIRIFRNYARILAGYLLKPSKIPSKIQPNGIRLRIGFQ